MGKVLLLLVFAALAWMLFRGLLRAPSRDQRPPSPKTGRGEDMVACARCGVNVPRSEAREEGGRWVCQGNPACR